MLNTQTLCFLNFFCRSFVRWFVRSFFVRWFDRFCFCCCLFTFHTLHASTVEQNVHKNKGGDAFEMRMCSSAICRCDAAAHIRVKNSMCWPVHLTFVLENKRWLGRSTLALPIAELRKQFQQQQIAHTFSLCHLLIQSIHEIALVETETCIFSQKRRNETPNYLVWGATKKKTNARKTTKNAQLKWSGFWNGEKIWIASSKPQYLVGEPNMRIICITN